MLYSKRLIFSLAAAAYTLPLTADLYVQDSGSASSSSCCTISDGSCTDATLNTAAGCYNAGSGTTIRLLVESTNITADTQNVVAPGTLIIQSDNSSGTSLNAEGQYLTVIGIDGASTDVILGPAGTGPIKFGGGTYPAAMQVGQGSLTLGPSVEYPENARDLIGISVLSGATLELQKSGTLGTNINIDASTLYVSGTDVEVLFRGIFKHTGVTPITVQGDQTGSAFLCIGPAIANDLTVDGVVFGLSTGITDINGQGAGAGDITLQNSATFQGQASFTLTNAHDLVLADGTNSIGAKEDVTLTLQGEISDGGSAYALAKTGEGTVIFDGTTSYTGKTTITEGILVVNSTIQDVDAYGVLRGAGTTGNVVVKPQGAIAAGASISSLTVSGDLTFEPLGVMFTEFSPTSVSVLNVTGDTALGVGAVLRVVPEAGAYTSPLTYDILYANNVTGTFASASAIAGAFMDVEVDYSDSTKIAVTITPRSINTADLNNNNAEAVAESLNDIISYNREGMEVTIPFEGDGAGGEASRVIVSFLAIQNTDIEEKALDQLHPAALKNIAVAQENASIQVQGAIGYRELALLETSGCSFEGKDPYQFWINGMGNATYQSDRRFSGSPQVGYKSSMAGFAAGGDYKVLEYLFVGAFGGYTSAHVNQYKNRGAGDVGTGYLGVYATGVEGIFYGNVSLGGGVSGYSARRNIDYGTVNEVARNSHGGSQFLGHIDVGFNLMAEDVTVRPFNRFDILTQTEDGYTETGASDWNLKVRSQDSTFLRNELGLIFGRCVSFKAGSLRISPKVSWVREVRTSGAGYTASFSSAPQFPFDVTGYFPDRDFVATGAVFTGTFLNDNLSFSVYYDGEFAGSFTAHKYGGEASYRF